VEFQFPTLDQICANILLLGRGALFWKLDLSQAYRNLPLHFMLWPRFAFTYGKEVFVDTRLPFGLRSAPYVFCKFMVIVVWTLAYVLGTESIFAYIDDIVGLEAPSMWSAGILRYQLAQAVLEWLGLLLSEKRVAPCTRGEILGIVVDTDEFTLSIPSERIELMRAQLSEFLDRNKMSRKEMESLIGSLKYFARVMRPARIFVARLIRFMYSIVTARSSTQVTLPALIREDLQWWYERVQRLNGTYHFYEPDVLASAAHFFADACAQGFACVFETEYFYFDWTNEQRAVVLRNMAVGECYAITCAAVVFALKLENKSFVLHSDSQDTVDVISRYYAKNRQLAEIVRTLASVQCDHHFSFTIEHIEGEKNIVADCISRSDMCRLQRLLGMKAVATLKRITVTADQMPPFPPR
jgi:hypothetical protein